MDGRGTTRAVRRPIVGVMGAGRTGAHPEREATARELGRLVAEAGWTLLTGGGGGVMAAASRGAAEAGGLVVGVLPADGPDDPRHPGYPNPYVHVPLYTGMGDARNAINAASSDVLVALPGGAGTLSEVALALKRLRPVVLLAWPDPALPPGCPPELVHRAADAREALALVRTLLAERR